MVVWFGYSTGCLFTACYGLLWLAAAAGLILCCFLDCVLLVCCWIAVDWFWLIVLVSCLLPLLWPLCVAYCFVVYDCLF